MTLDSLRQDFERDGYCIARQVFREEHLRGILDSLRASLANGDDAAIALDDVIAMREREDHEKIYRAGLSVGSAATTYAAIGCSGLLDIVSSVAGVRLADMHLMPLDGDIQQPGDGRFDYKWHQESAFYPWCRDILNVWFPLQRPSRKETGTMSVLPGSHQGGLRESSMYFGYGKFRQIEAEIPEGEENMEVAIEIDPGDVCIFHADLVHRSMPNKSSRPRLTGIIRVVNMATQPTQRPLYKAFSYEE